MPVGRYEDFVKAINLNVKASCKNLWSDHDLNLGKLTAADFVVELVAVVL